MMGSNNQMSLDQMNTLIAGFIATLPISEGIKVQALRDSFRLDAQIEGAAGTLAIISVGLELLQIEILNLASEMN